MPDPRGQLVQYVLACHADTTGFCLQEQTAYRCRANASLWKQKLFEPHANATALWKQTIFTC